MAGRALRTPESDVWVRYPRLTFRLRPTETPSLTKGRHGREAMPPINVADSCR